MQPGGAQGGEDMALLVLVVRRRGEVEVAHHVARGLARGVVAAHVPQVRAQPSQQPQHAVHPLVAGGQHVEGMLEAGRRRAVQRQR